MPLTMTRDAGARVGGDISSLLQLYPAAYYDSRFITGLADGDPVSTWSDLSGNGYHATQATAAKKPTYKVNIVNGLAVARLDAVDDGMLTPLVLAAPYTVIIVYDCNSGVSLTRRAIQGSSNWLIGPYHASWAHYAGGFVAGADAAGTDAPFAANTFGINTAVNNGTRSWFYVNGTDYTNNSGPVGAPGTVSFGATGFANEALSGDIATIAIWSRVLAGTELRAAHRLLSQTYSISVIL
jgi:hypothetical protein